LPISFANPSSGFYLCRTAIVYRTIGSTEFNNPQLTASWREAEQIAARIGRALERRGLVERDLENAWLARDTEAGPLDDLLGHSITYRIAVGPRAGQKLFTLQTVAPRVQGPEGEPNGAARAGGFSLHAGVDIAPTERAKLERLCRYVSRPPVASERLALTASGQVRYTLKTPYRDGTTHIVLEPLDLMARRAALVPKPRMHLTAVSRHVCPAQSVSGGGDAGAAGPCCSDAAGVWRGSDQAVTTTACGDELGKTAEASVRCRDRALYPLRWPAYDHRQHRGAAAHCEDPVAPGACCAGAVSERAAAWGAGAADAVQPAVNLRMSPAFIDR
jgi:hypothetical protein